MLWPRLPGSWPGATFTGPPLNLPAGQFGMGIGGGAHAPNEFWLIDSTNPKVAGMDGVVKSFVDLFYERGITRSQFVHPGAHQPEPIERILAAAYIGAPPLEQRSGRHRIRVVRRLRPDALLHGGARCRGVHEHALAHPLGN